jgi:hypothetical protein
MKLRNGKVIQNGIAPLITKSVTKNKGKNTDSINSIINTYENVDFIGSIIETYENIDKKKCIFDENVKQILVENSYEILHDLYPPRIKVIGSGIAGIDGYYKTTSKYFDMPWYRNEKSNASIYYLCGWKMSNGEAYAYETEHEGPETSYSQRIQLPPKEGSKWKRSKVPYTPLKGHIEYHWQ